MANRKTRKSKYQDIAFLELQTIKCGIGSKPECIITYD